MKIIEKIYKNAVFVFGDFTVFDKNGKDISYRFSPKLRSLFALILFHSIENEGISTDMLTAELWSNKDTNSAKNIRVLQLTGYVVSLRIYVAYHFFFRIQNGTFH